MFAEKLKGARVKAGLSHAELAAKCGLHERTVKRYELGQREPGPDNQKCLLEACMLPNEFEFEPDIKHRKPRCRPVDTLAVGVHTRFDVPMEIVKGCADSALTAQSELSKMGKHFTNGQRIFALAEMMARVYSLAAETERELENMRAEFLQAII